MSEPVDPLRRRLVLSGTLVAAPFVHGCQRQAEITLTAGGGAWGRAQEEAFYAPFTQATGIRIKTVPFVMPGKLRTSIEQGRPLLDVADMSGADLPLFVRDGLLQPIDRSAFRAEDLDGLAPLKAQEFAIPSLYASTVLAYRQELFKDSEPTGWGALWDLGRHAGPRSLASGTLGQMGALFETALLADGVDPARLYPLDWDRALRSLSRIRAHVPKYWLSAGEALQLLQRGDAVMSSVWNGPVDTPEARAAGTAFTWNQGILQAGWWAIPRGSANREHALRFMAFALQPERQAHFSQLVGYSPANARALALLSPERQAQMPTAPANRGRQVLQDTAWWGSEAQAGKTQLSLAVDLWERWVAVR